MNNARAAIGEPATVASADTRLIGRKKPRSVLTSLLHLTTDPSPAKQ